MQHLTILKVTLLSIALGSSHLGWAAPSGIPNPFQGRWGSPDQCTGQGEHPTKISAKEFKGHESLCVLQKVLKSEELYFEGVFMCIGEGEEWEDKISLQRVKDKLIINDGEATAKCK